MKGPAFALLVLIATTSLAWGICFLPPAVQFDPMPSSRGQPVGPTTPGENPEPPTNDPRDGTGAPRTRTGGASYAATWHVWWELNREHLLGLRTTLKGRDVVSGTAADPDYLARQRDRVREALRPVALGALEESLRRVALCALGRAGNEDDARDFLRILKTPRQPRGVYEGAAIGLGLLRRLDDVALRDEVRGLFGDLLAGGTALTGRTRWVAILALSLRGRADPSLAWALADRCKGDRLSGDESAALLYSCGLTQDPGVVPVLQAATLRGRIDRDTLHDAARSHAVLGLALTGNRSAASAIALVLKSRRTPIHTRRAAALALGLLLRQPLEEQDRVEAERVLAGTIEKARDPLVKGYAAVGMGTARVPFGVGALCATVERRGSSVEAPYAALALGLAAARLAPDEAGQVRRFLVHALTRARDIQLSAALSIALGVSGAPEARETLFARLDDDRLKASLRGPAIQGLGLLRVCDPEIERRITLALDDGADEVVEDASLALGLIGTRTTARLLVTKLAATRSQPVQVHMVAALSHLGGAAAIGPLIELLQDRSRKHTVRESAAAALGILVMENDHDPMFEIDAHCNPFALTVATRELVLLY